MVKCVLTPTHIQWAPWFLMRLTSTDSLSALKVARLLGTLPSLVETFYRLLLSLKPRWGIFMCTLTALHVLINAGCLVQITSGRAFWRVWNTHWTTTGSCQSVVTVSRVVLLRHLSARCKEEKKQRTRLMNELYSWKVSESQFTLLICSHPHATVVYFDYSPFFVLPLLPTCSLVPAYKVVECLSCH